MPRRPRGDGSITRLKNGAWRGYITLPGRVRQWFRGPTREVVAAKIRAALKEGTRPSRDTLQGLLDRWLQSRKPSLRSSGYEMHRLNVKRLTGYLGAHKLRDLKPSDVDACYAWMLTEGKLAPSTVLKVHSTLRQALKAAVGWGELVRNPTDLVRAPRVQRTEMQVLSREQARILVQQRAEGDPWHALWVLAVTCGPRLGEMLGLKWEDIDGDRLRIVREWTMDRSVKAWRLAELKSRASYRTVVLPDVTLAALEEHRRGQHQLGMITPYMFAAPNGLPPSAHRIYLAFHRTLQALELPIIRPHDLRHTCATLHLEAGANPRVVQELLGHSTVAITLQLYGHVTPRMHAAAAATMSTLMEATRSAKSSVTHPQTP